MKYGVVALRWFGDLMTVDLQRPGAAGPFTMRCRCGFGMESLWASR